MSAQMGRRPVFWPTLLRGAIAVLFGVLALFWPDITVLALVVVFGAFAIVEGVMAIGSAYVARNEHGSARFLYGLMGAVSVVAGLSAFFWPAITTIVLAWVIAFWALFTGALEMSAAFNSRSWEGRFGWFALISGAISVILGVLIIFQPAAGAVALAWMIGALALIWGIVLVLAGIGERDPGTDSGHSATSGAATSPGR